MISLAIAARFSDINIGSIDTKLHEYAFNGDLTGLKETLSSLSTSNIQSLLDKKNHLGCTALRLASTTGNTPCVQYLLSMGASVDIADIKGQTPLFVAVKNNHVKCVQILLESGANPEGDEANMATPLYTAALNGFLEIMKLLIQHGVNLKPMDQPNRVTRIFSNDALEVALAYHNFNCCKTLLLAGYETWPMSLCHILIRYKSNRKMLKLCYDFGFEAVSGDRKEDLNKLNEEKYFEAIGFLKYVSANPRSLMCSCRLTVRRHIKDLNRLDDLELPVSLIRYLLHLD